MLPFSQARNAGDPKKNHLKMMNRWTIQNESKCELLLFSSRPFFLTSISGEVFDTFIWNNPKPPGEILWCREVVRGFWGHFWIRSIDFSRQMVGDCKGNQNISGKLGGETLNIFFSPRKLGKMIQFDEHIFCQMGWNHQLENLGWWNMIPFGRNFPIWFWYFWMKVVATYAKVYLPIGRAVLPLWNPLSLVVETTRKPREVFKTTAHIAGKTHKHALSHLPWSVDFIILYLYVFFTYQKTTSFFSLGF